MPLKPMGVPVADAEYATSFVAQSFAVQEGYTVLTMADIGKLVSLEAARSLAGCSPNQAECVAQVSQALKADLVVTGSLGRVGKKLSINLALVDPRTSTSTAAATGDAQESRDLAQSMGTVVARLMGWRTAAQTPQYRLPSGGRTSLAVLDLTAMGVSTVASDNLTQVLSTELKRVEGTSVISREDIRAMLQLQEQKSLVGCDDMACLAEIGGALGVDRLVTGTVGKLSESYIVNLRLISVRQNRVEHLVTEVFNGSEDQLIHATRRAGRRLLGIESTETGVLAVTGSQQGSSVLVDGVPRGVVPLPPIQGIPAGAHTLLIVKSGFHDWSSDVYVEPAETTAVWVTQKSVPPRWFQRPWVWVLAGTASAATVVAVAAIVGAGVVGTVAVFRLISQEPATTSNGTATVVP
jgi:TolB-like protein